MIVRRPSAVPPPTVMVWSLLAGVAPPALRISGRLLAMTTATPQPQGGRGGMTHTTPHPQGRGATPTGEGGYPHPSQGGALSPGSYIANPREMKNKSMLSNIRIFHKLDCR